MSSTVAWNDLSPSEEDISMINCRNVPWYKLNYIKFFNCVLLIDIMIR